MRWDISTLLCQRHFHISSMIHNVYHLLLSSAHPCQNILLLIMLLTPSPRGHFKIPCLHPALLPSLFLLFSPPSLPLSSLPFFFPSIPSYRSSPSPSKFTSTLLLLGPISAFLLSEASPIPQWIGLTSKLNINLMKLKHLALSSSKALGGVWQCAQTVLYFCRFLCKTF